MTRLDRRDLLAGGASLIALAALPRPARASSWTPSRPVELVIMAGAGGGADQLARLIQSILQEERLTPMPILPSNKGGGSGAEALRYLQDRQGDPHVIMATLNSYYTTPLRQQIGVDVAEFTPLARLALDTFVLWVNAESEVETLDDYVEAVRAADGAWRMGGTGTGQEDSLVTAMLEEAFDVRHTYVPFDGGGQAATSLVGGHVDSTVNNPAEALGFWQAGRARPIATFTAERLAAMPDVPTLTELGHPLVYEMQRSFVGPPGMPEEAAAYYVDLLRQLSETEAWQTYARDSALLTDFLAGEALQAYLLAERDKHAELLKTLDAPAG